MQASQLLKVRRASDGRQDLWSTLKKVQENLIRGGFTRRTSERPPDADARHHGHP